MLAYSQYVVENFMNSAWRACIISGSPKPGRQQLDWSVVLATASGWTSDFYLAIAGRFVTERLAWPFLSLAFEPSLDPIRDQLEDVDLTDLDPEVAESLSEALGFYFDLEAGLDAGLDGLLEEFKEAYGLDLEKEVLAFMTGELSFALLPTDFGALEEDSSLEAVHALFILQFKP